MGDISQTVKMYAVGQRECWKLGDHYTKHSMAMTAEGLHRKSDIAAELGVRDAEIERLRNALSQSVSTVQELQTEIAQLRLDNQALADTAAHNIDEKQRLQIALNNANWAQGQR